jgi:hypothetical protein
MRRAVILALVFSGFASAAQALTIRDVIELSKAGLGEEVLLAVIEVDGGVFSVDTATIKSLKDAGVTERVIVALVRSGRDRAMQEPPPVPVVVEDPPPPRPQVVVIEHREPQVQQVVVPMPVYIPVATGHTRGRRGQTSTVESTYVPFQSGLPAVRPVQQETKPVYWGFGGKLRPDAWGQPADRDRDKEKRNDRDKN